MSLQEPVTPDLRVTNPEIRITPRQVYDGFGTIVTQGVNGDNFKGFGVETSPATNSVKFTRNTGPRPDRVIVNDNLERGIITVLELTFDGAETGKVRVQEFTVNDTGKATHRQLWPLWTALSKVNNGDVNALDWPEDVKPSPLDSETAPGLASIFDSLQRAHLAAKVSNKPGILRRVLGRHDAA